MSQPQQGSLNWYLSHLEVGGSHFVECEDITPAAAPKIRASITRRPSSMVDMEFKVELFTCVPSGGVQHTIRYVFRIERTA